MPPPVYSPVEFDAWPIFAKVEKTYLQRVVLLHVFGDEGRSALFITDDDAVYAVGSNDLGRLGIGEIEFTETPVDIPFLKNKQIKCFASGSVHTIALSESGELFSWGNNTLGRLGNGTILDRDTPGRVLLPNGEQVKAVSCADRYSLALTVDNKVLHWGDVQFTSCIGQNIPCELQFPSGVTICDIACGGFHAAALSTTGEVYTWGGNSLGQLGRDTTDCFEMEPTLYQRDCNLTAISIGCGLLTTIILYSNGSLDACGYFRNELECPPVKEFVISNMDHLICMRCQDDLYCFGNFEANDDEGNVFPGMDFRPQLVNARNMQSAFKGRATPQFLRASPQDLLMEPALVEAMQGPIRDIAAALFDRKDNSDLTVKLSDGVVYVHKLIMTTFCDHFKSMLLGSWASETKKEIDMQSYNAKAYRAFLKYIYSGCLDPLQGIDLIDLYDIAQSYFETELKEMIICMFRKRLRPENTANLFSLSHNNHCSELIELCYEYASGYMDEVILSEGFDNLAAPLGKLLVKEATKRKKKNI